MIRFPRSLVVILAVLSAQVFGCGLSFGGVAGGTFTNTGNDTVPRYFHRAGLLASGRVMVTGGLSLQIFPPSLISLTNISFYDTTTGTFSASFTPTGGGPNANPVLATPRSSHAQTTLADGRVLITGGYTGANGTNQGVPIASVEVFNPQTGTMSAGPAMSSARAGHRAILLADGRVLVAGGAFWQVFDPVGNSWSSEIALARSRNDFAAVRLPDFDGPAIDAVLLIGGSGSGNNTMEIVHPSLGSSTLMTSLLTSAVDDLAATLLDDGSVLIVGGQDLTTGNTLGLSYRFNPTSDSIVSVPPPPNRANGLADHAIVQLGRYVAIFGGEQEISGTDAELNYAAIYDSGIDDWIYNATMNHIHDDFPAVLLGDGRILLIGGGIPFFGNEAPSNTAELFTPMVVQIGDMNADEIISEADILPFVTVVMNPAGASARDVCAADANIDQIVDGRDVQQFAEILAGPP